MLVSASRSKLKRVCIFRASPIIIAILFLLVVGFFPTIYTVMEGVDPFVTLTLFRTGNINLTASVDLTTVPGSAVGTYLIVL